LKLSGLQRKVLVVVTDGEDNESNQSLERTVEILQHLNGPTVYAIGILSGSSTKSARRALETIAEKTGGMAFMPKTAEGVNKISETVARDIRSQYTLEYKPSKPPSDGGYRHIRVEARAPGYKDLHVRTRSGYFAGKERAAQ
jgi:VWFA-related protein